MKEWKQAVAVLTVMTALFIGQATLTRMEFSGLRADMNAVHDDLRDEIRAVRDNQVEMQGSIGELQRTTGEMQGSIGELQRTTGEMQGSIGEMERAIGEMQRSLGRIEGYLFGLDAEPADSA